MERQVTDWVAADGRWLLPSVGEWLEGPPYTSAGSLKHVLLESLVTPGIFGCSPFSVSLASSVPRPLPPHAVCAPSRVRRQEPRSQGFQPHVFVPSLSLIRFQSPSSTAAIAAHSSPFPSLDPCKEPALRSGAVASSCFSLSLDHGWRQLGDRVGHGPPRILGKT
jgi:hypothetical protein